MIEQIKAVQLTQSRHGTCRFVFSGRLFLAFWTNKTKPFWFSLHTLSLKYVYALVFFFFNV
jgi:hypothetical protein